MVTNAHRINSGVPPLTQGLGDFFLFVEDETEEAGVLAVDVAARRIPAKFGLTPAVTSRCSPRCTAARPARAISTACSSRPSPRPAPDLPEKRFGGRVFRVGDKVTQIRNNYDKGRERRLQRHGRCRHRRSTRTTSG